MRMSGKTSSVLTKGEKQQLENMSFEERLNYGAENAVRCMGVNGNDRVFIITDFARENLAHRVAVAALERHADVTVRFLEHYGERPLTSFPEALRNDLLQARPTVSFYIATARPGEIAFRIPLLPFLVKELGVRHGHMIGIDDEVMAEGMCADYDEVFSLTNQVYDLVRNARTIHVTSEKGTDVTGKDEAIAKEVRDYLFSTPNGNRVGEFAIGTLTSLTKLSGNLLQDEKMPGLHVAFGNPYPEFTGADWSAKIHVDVIPSNCTIEVDGRVIMRDGKFVI